MNKPIALAILFLSITALIYISHFLGLEFSNIRVKALCGMAIFILPWISILMFFVFGGRWLKVLATLIALPQILVTFVGLFLFQSLLTTVLTGADPSMVPMFKSRLDSGHVYNYYTGMDGDATVSIGKLSRYEESIFPGLTKFKIIDDPHPD